MVHGMANRKGSHKRGKHHYSEEEMKLAIGVCLFFLVAVLVGAVLANVTKNGDGDGILGGLGSLAHTESINFSGVYLKYLKYAFLIWIGGWIPFGLICSGVTLFFRGIFLGFTTSFLIKGYGLRGVFAIVSSYFLQNLILVPLYLFLTWSAILFFMEQRKIRIGKSGLRREKQRKQIEYTAFFLGGMICICFVSGLELVLSSVLWRMIG